MKFFLFKTKLKIRKNLEILFLLILTLISVATMQIYNSSKEQKKINYINLIENSYFEKTINHLFDQLKPKYSNIKHKIKSGETFDRILKIYEINDREI
jgi:hypothetical protein